MRRRVLWILQRLELEHLAFAVVGHLGVSSVGELAALEVSSTKLLYHGHICVDCAALWTVRLMRTACLFIA